MVPPLSRVQAAAVNTEKGSNIGTEKGSWIPLTLAPRCLCASIFSASNFIGSNLQQGCRLLVLRKEEKESLQGSEKSGEAKRREGERQGRKVRWWNGITGWDGKQPVWVEVRTEGPWKKRQGRRKEPGSLPGPETSCAFWSKVFPLLSGFLSALGITITSGRISNVTVLFWETASVPLSSDLGIYILKCRFIFSRKFEGFYLAGRTESFLGISVLAVITWTVVKTIPLTLESRQGASYLFFEGGGLTHSIMSVGHLHDSAFYFR